MVNPVPFDATTNLLYVAQKMTKRPRLMETMERFDVDEQSGA